MTGIGDHDVRGIEGRISLLTEAEKRIGDMLTLTADARTALGRAADELDPIADTRGPVFDTKNEIPRLVKELGDVDGQLEDALALLREYRTNEERSVRLAR